MVTFGLSSWSVHRSLQSGRLDLLDLPVQLRDHGLTDLQVCHFHLPGRDPAWLERFRRRIEDAGVTLDAMLLDFGDLASPEQADADAAELAGWLETSAVLGARFARIPAGKQPPTDAALTRAAGHLDRLAEVGERVGVRVVTENWMALLPDADAIDRLDALTRRPLALCFDTCNWSGPDKYEQLDRIVHRAVTVHAKCRFSPAGEPDAEDFGRTLGLLRHAGFAGTVSLIFDSERPDEWTALKTELDLARAVFADPMGTA